MYASIWGWSKGYILICATHTPWIQQPRPTAITQWCSEKGHIPVNTGAAAVFTMPSCDLNFKCSHYAVENSKECEKVLTFLLLPVWLAGIPSLISSYGFPNHLLMTDWKVHEFHEVEANKVKIHFDWCRLWFKISQDPFKSMKVPLCKLDIAYLVLWLSTAVDLSVPTRDCTKLNLVYP